MTDRPTADDLANKSERDLAYAWECADRLAEALGYFAGNHLSSEPRVTLAIAYTEAEQLRQQAAGIEQGDAAIRTARQALAEYRKARG